MVLSFVLAAIVEQAGSDPAWVAGVFAGVFVLMVGSIVAYVLLSDYYGRPRVISWRNDPLGKSPVTIEQHN